MKKIFLVTVAALLVTTPAYTQNKGDKYLGVQEIPAALQQFINGGEARYPEKLKSNLIGIIRENGQDPNFLDADDIKNAEEKKLQERRKRQVQELIVHDGNLDGQLTRTEVEESLRERRDQSPSVDQERNIKNQISKIFAADKDNDGVITLIEMGAFDEGKSNRESTRLSGLKEILALDPDKDGKLTVVEMEIFATKIFNTLDEDGNGIASPEEIKALQEIKRVRERSRVNTDICKISPAQSDEKVVFLGAYKGNTLTNISVAGQVSETNIIPVTIEKGEGKIYLVTSAFSPVIWQLKGDTSRISRVALAGRAMPEGTDNNDSGTDADKINVGITGIGADKVTFHRARDCNLHSAYEKNAEHQIILKEILKSIIKKEPSLSESISGMLGAQVYNDKIELIQPEAVPGSQIKMPDVNQDAWAVQTYFMPGGYIELNKQDVVSDAPAVVYGVLPKWAGIAQLLQSGALVAVTDKEIPEANIVSKRSKAKFPPPMLSSKPTFRIVKDIPYFPSGLFGAHSVDFSLAKGVKLPQGMAGHSCVTSEETGEVVEGICSKQRSKNEIPSHEKEPLRPWIAPEVPTCTIPGARDDEQIVFLGIYEGETLSNVSVAGQAEDTDVVPITIEKGDKKIYFVASAFSPVIWQMKGDTDRISRVALVSIARRDRINGRHSQKGPKKVYAGITNVPASQVTFHDAEICDLQQAFNYKPKEQEETKSTVKTVLGRPADLFNSAYDIFGAHITNDAITFDAKESVPKEQTDSAGFDKKAWDEQISFMAGGIIRLKKEDVVSNVPAVDYEVLPKWAGIAQLLQQGALVVAEGGNVHQGPFKIVKDIPFYPTGLHGAYSVDFVLGKGVKPPQGDAGHSCVKLEETEEQLPGSSCP